MVRCHPLIARMLIFPENCEQKMVDVRLTNSGPNECCEHSLGLNTPDLSRRLSMSADNITAARPFFQPRPECDDLQTAYLLWKIANTLRVSRLDCWEWQGSKVRNGYGRIGVNKKDWLVHRLIYELCVSHVPPSRVICHRCDNPSCCNPSHLYAGTQADNMRDAVSRGNHYKPCPKGSRKARKLTDDAVRDIRRRADIGGKGIVSKLAREYGVSAVLVSQVIHRHRYASVLDDDGDAK